MFNKTITQTPLTTELANGFFENIRGDRYRDDVSFVSTLRAFLHERIGDETVDFVYKRITHSADTVQHASANDLFNSIFRRRNNPDFKGIYLVDASADPAGVEAYAAKFDNATHGFVSATPNFRELADLREFTKPHMDARFYIDEEHKCTVVMVLNLNMRSFHLLQAIIPRMLPWHFVEKKFNDFDAKIARSLTQRYATDYEEIMSSLLDGIDLREYAIKNIIGGFESRARTQQLENVKREAEHIRGEIQQNMDRYRSLIERLDHTEINIAGLKAIIASGGGESELLDFFSRNRSIFPVKARDTSLEFIVKTYLDTFDPEMYATMAKNNNSHLFTGYTVGRTEFAHKKDRKIFLDAIFGEDAQLKIKSCSFYCLDMRGDAQSARNYHFPQEYDDFIPNPHLQYHNCLGNHRQFMNEALMRGDMIAAITQCMSSARSVNIGETVTMERFLRDLFNSSKKIIEMPDGSSMTPVEALAWLKNDGKAEEKESE